MAVRTVYIVQPPSRKPSSQKLKINFYFNEFSEIFVDQKVYCERFVYIFLFFGQLLTFEREREHFYSSVGSYEVKKWRGCKESKETQ
jgi:hypothetical protein